MSAEPSSPERLPAAPASTTPAAPDPADARPDDAARRESLELERPSTPTYSGLLESERPTTPTNDTLVQLTRALGPPAAPRAPYADDSEAWGGPVDSPIDEDDLPPDPDEQDEPPAVDGAELSLAARPPSPPQTGSAGFSVSYNETEDGDGSPLDRFPPLERFLPERDAPPLEVPTSPGRVTMPLPPLPGDEDGGPQMGGFVMASELDGPPRMPPPNLPPQPGMIQRRPSLTAMSDPPLPQQMPFQPPINQGQAPPMQAERACARRRC